MIKNLYLIRHGEAEHLVGQRLTGGWTDSNLTALGRVQAEKTGKRISIILKNADFDFYCSDLVRARETAEIIGRDLSKAPSASKQLRELNNGDAANLTSAQACRIALPMTEPRIDWIHYPNAESWRKMNDRVFEFMSLLDKEMAENIVIVTHRGIILAIIDWWLELNEHYINKISYDIDPCSITYLRINKWGEKTISKMNDTSHINEKIK